ncbi:MAG: TonB-dependent receptor [Rhizobiaceae bacterium]
MFTHDRPGVKKGYSPQRCVVLLGTMVLGGLFVLAGAKDSRATCASDKACSSQLEQLLNAEKAAEGGGGLTGAPQAGVSITIGEDVFNGPLPPGAGVDLSNVDIKVKFDGLDLQRQLNVSTDPELRHPDQPVRFKASWNYGYWIERAEIRITQADPGVGGPRRPVAVIAIDPDGNAEWQPEPELFKPDEALNYVLRVYDANGRHDETHPLSLVLGGFNAAKPGSARGAPPGESEDRTAISNIVVNGGMITVYGDRVPTDGSVSVNGRNVPVDGNGRFVTSTIMPSGDHAVQVQVHAGQGGDVLEIERDVSIPRSEFFYVGLADITVGKRFGKDSKALTPAAPGEYDPVYKKGRLAFYLKGKVQGRYLVTAALDTREEDLDEIFSNMDAKDPRQLLRRLDPDDYYAVYGDDSTTIEDAPTSGKFYVRVDDGNSHVMWGNFRTSLNGTELVRFDRTLYGASAQLRSNATTSSGEPAAGLTAFGAQPGTLPQRDDFLGTGGSVYFLRRQDISIGSEQVYVEERDAITGVVVNRTLLRPDTDYSFDHVQGIVLLAQALPSHSANGGAIQSSTLGGNENHLVVTYEYTPASGQIDGYSYGGRAYAWIGDHVRVGVTGINEETGPADQVLLGADLVLRHSEKTYFEFEWARSDGPGFGAVKSTDGGFVFDTSGAFPASNGVADAWRARAAIDLGEVSNGALRGTIGGYVEDRESGFSAPGRNSILAERLWGAFADFGDDDLGRLRLGFDSVTRENGASRQEGFAEARRRVNETWTVTTAVRQSDVDGDLAGDGNGKRIDTGMRIERQVDPTLKTWISGQVTVARDDGRERNDRIGIGAEKQFTDKLTATLETSYGTSGLGLRGGIEYAPTASDRYHIGYEMTPDTTAGGMASYNPFIDDYGSIVFGSTRKLSDTISVYSEENYDLTGRSRSMTHTYGVSYTPEPAWKLTAGVEAGEIRDSASGDFDRVAVSAGAAYKDEGLNASLRLEARFEDGETGTTRDRNTYLLRGSTGIDFDRDWRFLARIDGAFSQSQQDTILNGDYVESSIGFAYRPAEEDRLNALFKYSYLYDLPGAQQVNSDNQLNGPRQKSHVLSADFIYDLTDRLSIGAKYGIRAGQVEWVRGSGDFETSTAQLAIARADFHVVKQWDIMVEGRALWLSEADQINYGMLAGVYRHIGDSMKIGVGYNFGRFSDDLTNLVLDDEGVFVNVIGKF